MRSALILKCDVGLVFAVRRVTWSVVPRVWFCKLSCLQLICGHISLKSTSEAHLAKTLVSLSGCLIRLFKQSLIRLKIRWVTFCYKEYWSPVRCVSKTVFYLKKNRIRESMLAKSCGVSEILSVQNHEIFNTWIRYCCISCNATLHIIS